QEILFVRAGRGPEERLRVGRPRHGRPKGGVSVEPRRGTPPHRRVDVMAVPRRVLVVLEDGPARARLSRGGRGGNGADAEPEPAERPEPSPPPRPRRAHPTDRVAPHRPTRQGPKRCDNGK